MSDHITRATEIDAHIRGWPTSGLGLPDLNPTEGDR